MRQPTNPREFPETRDNRLFPVPVRAYAPSDLPVPEDLRDWGLESRDEYTTEATPADLNYSLRVYRSHGEQWLVREHQGHPPLLIPFPSEQVAYAYGDEVFRRTSFDEAVLAHGVVTVPRGVVTVPDSRSRNASWKDFNDEWVQVRWEGESQDQRVMGRDIQLDRREARCKLM